ncbi:hypothetical protein HaLaN_21696 [Haematococcus lacustris]|uniref:Uncharacterized protein n=1 Tax=Haematococcus lacustris TaxID=44745 RepID=A0A699ZYW9_HAELA|nr:hypothetical protein HaLaN_21696 [Haematococcus lacustris]
MLHKAKGGQGGVVANIWRLLGRSDAVAQGLAQAARTVRGAPRLGACSTLGSGARTMPLPYLHMARLTMPLPAQPGTPPTPSCAPDCLPCPCLHAHVCVGVPSSALYHVVIRLVGDFTKSFRHQIVSPVV